MNNYTNQRDGSFGLGFITDANQRDGSFGLFPMR